MQNIILKSEERGRLTQSIGRINHVVYNQAGPILDFTNYIHHFRHPLFRDFIKAAVDNKINR